jgi:hypothetical protein
LPAFPVSHKILGVQPNKLEHLDDLLAQAEHYANDSMHLEQVLVNRDPNPNPPEQHRCLTEIPTTTFSGTFRS